MSPDHPRLTRISTVSFASPSVFGNMGVLDSGSHANVCSLRFIELYKQSLLQHGIKYSLKPMQSKLNLQFANGEISRPLYCTYILLCIGVHQYQILVHVLDNYVSPLLLSREFMDDFRLSITWHSDTIQSPYFGKIRGARDQYSNMLLPLLLTQPALQTAQIAANRVSYDNLSRKQLLHIHCNLGHATVDKLLLYFSRSLGLEHIPKTMRDQIQEIVSNCESCRLKHRFIRNKVNGIVSPRVNCIVSFDLTELRVYDKKYLICALVDLHSGFVYADFIPDKRSFSIISIIEKWSFIFGSYPEVFLSDNAKEHLSHEFFSYCAYRNIRHVTSLTYHAHQNGPTERRNFILKQIYRIIFDHFQKNFPEFLSPSYIGSILSDTCRSMNAIPGRYKYSPYHICFGRPSVIHTSLFDLSPSQNIESIDPRTDLYKRIVIQNEVSKLVNRAQIDSKLHLALQARLIRSRPFSYGDTVYFFQKLPHTSYPLYTGPYRVVGHNGTFYILEQNGKLVRAQGEHLTPGITDRIEIGVDSPDDTDLSSGRPHITHQTESQPQTSTRICRPSIPHFGHFDYDEDNDVNMDRTNSIPSIPHNSDVFMGETPNVVRSRTPEPMQVDPVVAADPRPLSMPPLLQRKRKVSEVYTRTPPSATQITPLRTSIRREGRGVPLEIVPRNLARSLSRDRTDMPLSPERQRPQESPQPSPVPDENNALVLLPSQEEVSSQHASTSSELDMTECSDCGIQYERCEANNHKRLFCQYRNEESATVLGVHAFQVFSVSVRDLSNFSQTAKGMRSVSKSDLAKYKQEFDAAKLKELNSWKENDVYDLIEIVDDSLSEKNLIPMRWVTTWKFIDPETVESKARLVLQGFRDLQQNSIRIDSPTVHRLSIRLILSWAVYRGFTPGILDVKTAFLQSRNFSLESGREVFAVPPDDVRVILGLKDTVDYVFRLKKSIYGLKDAPREFFLTLTTELSKLMTSSTIDRSLFFYHSQDVLCGVIGLHVDDLVFCGDQAFLQNVMNRISAVFRCGKFENGSFVYCGLKIVSDTGTVSLSQSEYANSISEVSTTSGNRTSNRVLNSIEVTKFRSALGCLSWLSGQSRPDIAFRVNRLSTTRNSPTSSDVVSVNKLIRYVQYSSDFSLIFRFINWSRAFILLYTDSSLGNVEDSYSQGAFVLFLAELKKDGISVTLLDWNSKKLRRIARSSLTAETLAMNDSVDHGLYMRALIREFIGRDLKIEVLNDNNNLIQLIHSDKSTTEKRILLDLAALREHFRTGIRFHFVPTRNCLADGLTKMNASSSIKSLCDVMRSSFIPRTMLPDTLFD